MFQSVNQFRADNGLPLFQFNSALATAAQNQANYMAANTVYSSHIGAGGSTPQSRANAAGYTGNVTENIVGGTGMTARQGLNWWINSPVHYSGLISTRHIEAGTGFATNGTQNFYVLVIGNPSSQPPASNNDNSPAPLIITPIELAQPNEDGSIVHVVQEGQALWTLAAYYEVPLSSLLLFNQLKEDAFLQPGDEVIIRLADGQAPPPTPTPPTTHTVQAGQSLWSIAVLYDVKLGDLLWFNNLREDAILQPGEEIVVRLLPGQSPPPTPTPITTHIVRSGQTLWDIAFTYDLTLDELLAMNDIDDDVILHPGDALRVRLPVTPAPSPETATAVSTPATPTQTPTPTRVINATGVSQIQPVSERTAVTAPSPTPVLATNQVNQTVITSVLLIAGIGLTILAGTAVIAIRRQA